MTKNQNRKPFGSIDGNVRASEKNRPIDDVRKSKSGSVASQPSQSHATFLTNGIPAGNLTSQFDLRIGETRRDSKTPKMSNRAYAIENLGNVGKPRTERKREQPTKDATRNGLDPSPLKLPDPTSSSSANKSLSLTMKRHSKSKLRDGADGLFVSD